MNFRNLIIIPALFLPLFTTAQLSEYKEKQIDSLFIEWNKPDMPGGVIGVMKDDTMLYAKSLGFASIEYQVRVTDSTLFNIGSVSKQFTGMGIVRLAGQSRLSFDDDIRKYIPELPQFDRPVTIRNLLHHTSGLRSFYALLALAGWRADDYRTNDDLMRFLVRQQALNFLPGDEYLYCNTGYILLAEIIQRVTGEKFTAWMKDSVFIPLGMLNTYIEDDPKRIVADNATSYYRLKSDSFERALAYWGYTGSGNMHSTTDDLLTWLKNFYNPEKGWEDSFRKMLTTDTLNNGEENNYAFGIEIGSFDSYKRLQHRGGVGGFRSFICTYPSEKLSIVILTNFSSSGCEHIANRISELILGRQAESEQSSATDTAFSFIHLTNKDLAAFEASYWCDKDNYARKITLRDDTLRYCRTGGIESALLPLTGYEFKMTGVSNNIIVQFYIDASGKKIMVVNINNNPPILFEEYLPVMLPEEAYTGCFYSPELETAYTISVVYGKLVCHHPRLGDFDLKVLRKDLLQGKFPFELIRYIRDDSDTITGIRVSNPRVKNLWFEKR